MQVLTENACFPCGYCGALFVSGTLMVDHVLQLHPQQQMSPQVLHACLPCGALFPSESQLQQHVATAHVVLHLKEPEAEHEVHGEELREVPQQVHQQPELRGEPVQVEKEEEQTKDKSDKAAKWRCDVCNKVFPFRARLLRHAAIHLRPEDRTREFGCDLCPKRFFRRRELKVHLKAVHGQCKFECSQCGQQLASSGALHNHMASKHGQRSREAQRFVCDICNRSFALKQKLEVHRLSHEGKKPFQCDHCERSFVHKQSLVAHQRRVHPGVQPKERSQCGICGKLFVDDNYLRRHLRAHNKKGIKEAVSN